MFGGFTIRYFKKKTFGELSSIWKLDRIVEEVTVMFWNVLCKRYPCLKNRCVFQSCSEKLWCCPMYGFLSPECNKDWIIFGGFTLKYFNRRYLVKYLLFDFYGEIPEGKGKHMVSIPDKKNIAHAWNNLLRTEACAFLLVFEQLWAYCQNKFGEDTNGPVDSTITASQHLERLRAELKKC